MKLARLLRFSAASTVATLLWAPTAAITAPQGCTKLRTDSDWPGHAIWKAALPGVIRENGSDANGPLPDYRLRAENNEEVQAAVLFAKKHNIRLSIITTGHDQLGRNSAGSGLMIDLSLLKGVKVHESFTPTSQGLETLNHTEVPNVITPRPGVQAAVTFGPAVAGQALNYAVAPSGLFTMSGASGTVAIAGGWGQNGGYGPMTSQYGLGVDQWLEAKIVTPDGELKVLNSVTNTDIFWAIRGGGGGTFGVVVEATWKAYPTVPITGFNWYINSTSNETNLSIGKTPMSDAMEYLLSELPRLQQLGITGYFYVSPNTVRCYAIHPGELSGIENANSVWGPILSKMQSFPGMTPFQTRPYNFSNYKEFFDTTYGPLINAHNGPAEPRSLGIVQYDSRLLAAEHVQSSNITWALRGTHGHYGILMCSPGSRVGDGSDTAANPGWRRAVVLLMGFKSNETNVDGLRELAPDMGTYINEASVTQEHWTSAFWGSNYPKLSKLKEDIDPDMLFWISPGINANYRQAIGGRACLVEPRPTGPSLIPPPMDRHVEANMTKDKDLLFGKLELIGTTYPDPGTWVGLQPA